MLGIWWYLCSTNWRKTPIFCTWVKVANSQVFTISYNPVTRVIIPFKSGRGPSCWGSRYGNHIVSDSAQSCMLTRSFRCAEPATVQRGLGWTLKWMEFMSLEILCDLFGMLRWPFSRVKFCDKTPKGTGKHLWQSAVMSWEYKLVGGFISPEKYASQIGSSPQVRLNI